MRDITTLRFSTAIRSPASPVQSAEPKSSCAMIAVNRTTPVPATAEENRQPNSSMPKALMPIAISHLPSGGCTQDPTSHFFSRQ